MTADNSEAVRQAVVRFREAGQTKFIVQISPSSRAEAITTRAKAEGLVEHPLAWAKFVCKAQEAPWVNAGVAVSRVAADEADLFASTAVAGFGMPPAMSAWLRQIVGKPGWSCFVGAVDGAPITAGALFVQGDYGWVGIGATKAEARKRGAHSTLLAHRIAEAGRAGARWVVTETGVPQPNQPARRATRTSSPQASKSPTRPNWTETG